MPESDITKKPEFDGKDAVQAVVRAGLSAIAVVGGPASELFALLRSGTVRLRIGQTYALKDAARAHRDLAGRKTTGSTLLIP